MKIAVVSAYTKSHAGIRADLIRAFVERGHEVVVFGGDPENEWGEFFAERGCKYRQFLVQRTGTNPIQDLGTILSLKRLYKEERPDRVFTYHAKGNIYGSIAAHQAGIDEIYSLVAGLGSIFRDDPGRFNLVRYVMGEEYRLALKHAKKVLFQNDDDRNLFVEKDIVDFDKTVIVNGSGVDLKRFTRTLPPREVSFLFVGRLIKDKGIREFIEAAKIVKKEFPEARFDIVGDVDDNPTSLQAEEVAAFRQEGIATFHGPQDDVVPFYQNCAVFVLPSYHEGTPRSALEALSVGRPVILTDAPGCREVVRDAVNGFMVPVRDSAALAEAMKRFLREPGLVSTMGEKSRAIAEEKYDVNKVNESICAIMEV